MSKRSVAINIFYSSIADIFCRRRCFINGERPVETLLYTKHKTYNQMELTDIHFPQDIKHLTVDELTELCGKIRATLLEKLSRHGGHIGPNLGMVEATVALHYVFDAPTDKIVFDVSHQTYVHKMLTGRMEAFTDPAHYGDVTGFTNPAESPYDLFTIGHTSTAVSLAGGLAKARDIRGITRT